VRNPLRAASPSFGCASGRGKPSLYSMAWPAKFSRPRTGDWRAAPIPEAAAIHSLYTVGQVALTIWGLASFFACPTAACCSLAVLLEPKQRRSTTAKKGPTDCRGRPLVEVSGPSFRRTAKARFLPGQLSIGPFQQSRFSTAKVPTVEHKKRFFISLHDSAVVRPQVFQRTLANSAQHFSRALAFPASQLSDARC
jgi:hypothetical protein